MLNKTIAHCAGVTLAFVLIIASEYGLPSKDFFDFLGRLVVYIAMGILLEGLVLLTLNWLRPAGDE